MTKKGLVLIGILVVLLTGIIISVSIQSYKVNEAIKRREMEEAKKNNNSEFALNITDETGFDLKKLKSYGLPIIIQIGSSLNDMCADMNVDLEELNKETRGKAIVKYLDTEKYKELWSEDRIDVGEFPVQILIDNNGKPYETTLSEALGFKKIKDENGNHIYTVHEGDLTLNDMKGILIEMGIK